MQYLVMSMCGLGDHVEAHSTFDTEATAINEAKHLALEMDEGNVWVVPIVYEQTIEYKEPLPESITIKLSELQPSAANAIIESFADADVAHDDPRVTALQSIA